MFASEPLNLLIGVAFLLMLVLVCMLTFCAACWLLHRVEREKNANDVYLNFKRLEVRESFSDGRRNPAGLEPEGIFEGLLNKGRFK